MLYTTHSVMNKSLFDFIGPDIRGLIIIMMGSYNARLFTLLGTQGAAVGQPQRSSGSHRHTLTTRNQKHGTEFYGKESDF